MVTRRMIVTALTLVNTLLSRPAAAAPERFLLSDQPVSLPGWETAPDLTRSTFRPDLLSDGCPSIEQAAARLAAAVAASNPPPRWVRLETIDLTAVGDCEDCQPPPLDPHAFGREGTTATLDERQFRFFAEAAGVLANSAARPYVVVPPATALPPLALPAGLYLFLASPPVNAASSAAGPAARAETEAAWRQVAPLTYSLVTDGLGDFAGLPLTSDLLRRQWSALRHPAVIVRDQAALEQVGPDWLAARLAGVAAEGVTHPTGDPYRADEPELARALDVFVPLADRLGELPPRAGALVRTTLAAAAALRTWEQTQSVGQAKLRAALNARQEVRGRWEPRGLFSQEFAAFITSAAQPQRLTLAAGKASIDGAVADGEWPPASRLTLTLDDWGRPSPRPATVYLMASDEALQVAVVATEPRPDEAGLRDCVLLCVAPGHEPFPVCRLRATVGGEATLAVLDRPGPAAAERAVRLDSVAVFDGPGWVLEAAVPWELLGLARGGAWRLNVVTEHRRGKLHTQTVWQPTGGGLWNSLRYGWLSP
ncbi:MAG: hypothetical protein HUU35_02455 [Armatimonadetes bacterium]|nr:hypothetical protein [Armatimonadota bacterium]